jgi:predicted transcriptional regulator
LIPFPIKNNIRKSAESLQVKDEEIDWLIYHLIPTNTPATPESLMEQSGLDPSAVAASLKRLEQNSLIDQRDGKVCMLSINEALLRCQVRYDTTLPYTIENGVIREKKRP